MKVLIDQLNSKQYFLMLVLFFFLMFLSALPGMSAFYILGDLGGGVETASYGMTLFSLGSLSTKPLGVILANNFGNVRSVKICAWAMFFTFIPAMWVDSYYGYLCCRFLNGFCAGPMFLLIVHLCAEHMNKEKAEQFVHRYLLLMIIVPVVSTVFGGIISYGDIWQLAFGITAFLFLIACVFLQILFHRMEVPCSPSPIDWIGWICFCIAVWLMGFCFITGEVINGFRSLAFTIIFTLGCAFSLFYICWAVYRPRALLDWSLFKNLDFSLLMFNTFWIVSFHFAALVLLSYWLHLFVNYSVQWVAFVAIFVFLGAFGVTLAIRAISFGRGLALTMSTFFLMGSITYFVSLFNSEVNLGRIAIAHTGMGIAYALYLPRIVYRLRSLVHQKEILPAFCLFAAIRAIGNVFGIGYFTTVWDRRFVFYYTRLGGTLTEASNPLQATWRMLNYFNFNSAMKLEGLNNALSRQASSLALTDTFRLMSWIIGGLFILTLVFKIIERLVTRPITALQ